MLKIKRLLKSFQYAWEGVKFAWQNEQNFRVQTIIALIIVVLMFVFPTKAWEKIALFLIIMIILTFELLNTIFEHLIDLVQPKLHPYVREIKNLMSATVLLAAISAVVIGLIIFIPYIFEIIE